MLTLDLAYLRTFRIVLGEKAETMSFGENSVQVRREECHCGTKMRSDRSFPAIRLSIELS